MIEIYKELIKKYINNLREEDIKKYASLHNETLTNEETKIIYNHIKKHYNELLNKDHSSFQYLKKNLRKDLFDKIVHLYNEYNKYI